MSPQFHEAEQFNFNLEVSEKPCPFEFIYAEAGEILARILNKRNLNWHVTSGGKILRKKKRRVTKKKLTEI